MMFSLSIGQFEDARQILRDIDSLDNHSAFLFTKIIFVFFVTNVAPPRPRTLIAFIYE